MASSKEKSGRLVLYDVMAVPGRSVSLMAELVEEGFFTRAPLGGEVLLFLHQGRSVGQAMTGGDGRAIKPFVPVSYGVTTVAVQVVNTRRVTAPEATARLFIWDRRRPLLVISLTALLPRSRSPILGLQIPLPVPGARTPDPERGAVAALTALARRAHLLYMTSADRLELSDLRQWADRHRLPPGPIFPLKAGPLGLAQQLEGWRREGWTNLTGGVAGTLDEAKALLAKGLKVVAPPSAPASEKWPDEVIKPKDWAEVAKRLLP